MKVLRNHLLPLIWLASLTVASVASAQVQDIEWIMYRDPKLPTPEVKPAYPDGLPELWTQALELPQRDLQRRAAAAIRLGHKCGLPGLEVTIPPLEKMLAAPEQNQVIRLTVAQTLVSLDARQSAPVLVAALREGDLDMAEIVEPALARWTHEPACAIWQKRLNSKIKLRRLHILAIRGLVAAGDKESIPNLQELAVDHRTPMMIRLAAAEGLGKLKKTGLEPVAQALTENGQRRTLIDRLVAVKMLASHDTDETVSLLITMTSDDSPSVQAIALDRLLAIDPQLVMPMASQLITSRDVAVRSRIAEGLASVAATPDPEKIPLLSLLLSDPNPSLRGTVRKLLEELGARETLRETVLNEARKILHQDDWRGQSQSAQLLANLDDKEIAQRLVELLESQRPEAHTSAAWGLCQIRVPETLQGIHAAFKRKTEAALAGDPLPPETMTQLAHLAQAIGRMDYIEADDVLRKYVPKGTPLDPVSRAAAIWALGHLHKDRPDKELASLLHQRMTDLASLEPEEPIVRRFSTISLGRMKIETSVAKFRQLLVSEQNSTATGIACGWALQQVTGEPLPIVAPILYHETKWFLIPDNSVVPEKPAGK